MSDVYFKTRYESVEDLRTYVDSLDLGSKAEIPDRVTKKNRVFQKGMLIPYNTMRDENGVALFGKVDSDKVHKAWVDRECQLCGYRIAKDDWCVFPGAFGLWKFQEAPLHVECARYSLLVCPHIIKNRAFIGVSICKKYVVVECEPPDWNDPGCVPVWDGIKDWEKFSFEFGHSLDYNVRTKTTTCRTCPETNEQLPHMTYDEFMKWSHR
jgi:hypothetical protein